MSFPSAPGTNASGEVIVNELRICARCLYRFPNSAEFETCPLCADDRGSLSRRGQRWTTESMITYTIETEEIRQWLHALAPSPAIPPGNRALLVKGDFSFTDLGQVDSFLKIRKKLKISGDQTDAGSKEDKGVQKSQI